MRFIPDRLETETDRKGAAGNKDQKDYSRVIQYITHTEHPSGGKERYAENLMIFSISDYKYYLFPGIIRN